MEEIEKEFFEAIFSSASDDVADYVAGNISKCICKATNCKLCETQLINADVEADNQRNSHLLDLSKGV